LKEERGALLEGQEKARKKEGKLEKNLVEQTLLKEAALRERDREETLRAELQAHRDEVEEQC